MSDNDEELERLRKRKLQEFRQQLAAEDMKEKEQLGELRDAKKKLMLRRMLEPEARERLARIRMARPEYVDAVEQQLLALSQRSNMERKIDDDTLKKILRKIMPKKREIQIQRR